MNYEVIHGDEVVANFKYLTDAWVFIAKARELFGAKKAFEIVDVNRTVIEENQLPIVDDQKVSNSNK